MPKNRRRRGARLEMTSLMDVMFLVLVFFIYCIFDMTVHKGLKVDLPNAAGAEEKGERVVLTILADDALQLNGAAVTRDEALAKVKALYATGAKMPVLIFPYNFLLGLLAKAASRLEHEGSETRKDAAA